MRWRGAASEAALSSRAASAYQLLFSGLRQGTFHRGKVPKTRRGLRPPVPPWGCAACIPRRGIAQAVTLHRAVPLHTAHPFPASRGTVESDDRYGYRDFLKGRTNCPGTGVDFAHSGFCVRSSRLHRRGGYQPPAQPRRWSGCGKRTRAYLHRRGAHCASVPRSGLSQRVQWLREAVCTAVPPLPVSGRICNPPRQLEAGRVRSAMTLRRGCPADARCAPLRRGMAGRCVCRRRTKAANLFASGGGAQRRLATKRPAAEFLNSAAGLSAEAAGSLPPKRRRIIR